MLIVSNYIAEADEKIGRLQREVADLSSTPPVLLGHRAVEERLADSFDVLILSGSQANPGSSKTLAAFAGVSALIKAFRGTILGICFGHQIIATTFGGSVAPLGYGIKGFSDAEVLMKDPLFDGLPTRLTVAESHKEVVTQEPSGFVRIARTSRYDVEAIRHSIKPIYGVQFHPERYDEQHLHGRKILENFLTIARRAP